MMHITKLTFWPFTCNFIKLLLNNVIKLSLSLVYILRLLYITRQIGEVEQHEVKMCTYTTSKEHIFVEGKSISERKTEKRGRSRINQADN